MASVSYSLKIESDEQPDTITVDAQAPNANDVEVRILLTNLKDRNQVILALQAIERYIENQGSVDLGVV